jgi:hypothetical protein
VTIAWLMARPGNDYKNIIISPLFVYASQVFGGLPFVILSNQYLRTNNRIENDIYK